MPCSSRFIPTKPTFADAANSEGRIRCQQASEHTGRFTGSRHAPTLLSDIYDGGGLPEEYGIEAKLFFDNDGVFSKDRRGEEYLVLDEDGNGSHCFLEI